MKLQIKNAILQTLSAFKTKNTTLFFILLLGVVSLFTDMTYEAARSITGPYLALLGASGTIVGVVAGFGELVGYGLRLASGVVADRTQRYWTITFIGYACNFIAVPMLALAGNWPLAAALIIIERMGKAIRNPVRDAMLSYATHKFGSGLGFGIHQALDQAGGLIGPLIVTLVLFFKGSYQNCFAVLLIPAFVALAVLWTARKLYPNPENLEKTRPELEIQQTSKLFWIYLFGCASIAAGYVDFPLIAYHFQKSTILPPIWVPIFYAIAMGISALSTLVLGRIYDQKGLVIVIIATLISLPFAPLVFIGKFYVALIGMIMWGIGMGAQRSVVKAVISNMVPKNKRGSAYGIFNTGFGIAWFLGSALMGVLYDHHLWSLIIFSMLAQLASIPLFIIVWQRQAPPKTTSGNRSN